MQFKSFERSTRVGLPLCSEELDGALVLRDDDGPEGTDSLHLIEKPSFAEVGIEDVDDQGVLCGNERLETGRDVHAVGSDGDKHHVFVKVDGRFLEQRILAGRGGVGLADRPLGDLAHERIVLGLSLDDLFGRVGSLAEVGPHVDPSLIGGDDGKCDLGKDNGRGNRQKE